MSWLGTTDDPTNAKPELKNSGFRVDLWQHQFGFYLEYTHRTKPVTRAMAQSLADGLTRQGMGCRIVELPSQREVAVWSYHFLQGDGR